MLNIYHLSSRTDDDGPGCIQSEITMGNNSQGMKLLLKGHYHAPENVHSSHLRQNYLEE